MKYIDKLNDHLHNEYTKTIYEYGIEHKYPIMELNGIANLLFMIKQNNVKRILEIGTAISYSAHMMASVPFVERIDTIERDLDTAKIAEEFIKNGPSSDVINLIIGDALEIDNNLLLNEYDLILFDAAKVQNIRFFEKYSPLLKEQGILVTDNILFHGCVENRENLTKNVLNMVKKIDKYNEFLKQLDNYNTYFLPVGDGQAIAVKKGK